MSPDLHTTLQRLRSGHTDPITEMERALDAAQSKLCEHAFVRLSPDEARAVSGSAEVSKKPLAGLSVSIKDLFDIAGQTTCAGSRVLQDAPPAAQDCPAVSRLRRAGASLIGRTNMSEFAFSGVGINPHFGTPTNPCDTQIPRIPGGSSSGAAVSVATGAAFIGLGSDTGGSIRIPAALTGTVGFKGSAALVPTEGALPLSTTLDTVCAITRSVADAIIAHELLAQRWVTRSAAPLASYSLGVASTVMLEGLDATVTEAWQRTLETLHNAGVRVKHVALPEINELQQIQAKGGFSAVESYTWHRHLLASHSTTYDPRVAARMLRGASMSACDYIELQNARRNWISRMDTALQGFDAILSPTVPVVAAPISEVAPGAPQDEAFFQLNAMLLRNTSVINMLDGCAISLPCHVGSELPVGLMVWAGGLRDDSVLNIALGIEKLLQYPK
jgi:Asp-tRNA(Asn)/Glu-tRNA(Gln) amidotransferase A subunit family amidase